MPVLSKETTRRFRKFQDTLFLPFSVLFRFFRIPVGFVTYTRAILVVVFLISLKYWPYNIILFLLALFLDPLDGAYARHIRKTTRYGNELDKKVDLFVFIFAVIAAFFLGFVSWLALLCIILAVIEQRFGSASRMILHPERQLFNAALIIAAFGVNFVFEALIIAIFFILLRLLWR